MDRLFSNKKIGKSKKDVNGYSCNAFCSAICISACSYSCSGSCQYGCSGCDGTCSNLLGRL
ncbi:hypothetical protein Clo1100_0196 [Clostridium sp. BNL1100]|nr:hypothetical protein Clo1100_0196 [Clostridium sp. BNL1100]